MTPNMGRDQPLASRHGEEVVKTRRVTLFKCEVPEATCTLAAQFDRKRQVTRSKDNHSHQLKTLPRRSSSCRCRCHFQRYAWRTAGYPSNHFRLFVFFNRYIYCSICEDASGSAEPSGGAVISVPCVLLSVDLGGHPLVS